MTAALALALLALVFIAWGAFIARACGASWNPIKQTEIVFALPFGGIAYFSSGSVVIGIIGALVSYLGFQTGHGNFYAMNGVSLTNDDPELIEILRIPVFNGFGNSPMWSTRTTSFGVRPLYVRLGGDIHKPLYSWVCMGVKGTIVGLAAFPAGLLLALLWPFAYWLSFRVLKPADSATGECMVGAFAYGTIVLMLQ